MHLRRISNAECNKDCFVGISKIHKTHLAFLAKYQGLVENTDSFRSPRRDYDRRDVRRRTQD